jgi:hypothetical protein
MVGLDSYETILIFHQIDGEQALQRYLPKIKPINIQINP